MTKTEQRIDSPCIRQCCLNVDDICLGCFRSLKEICQWSEVDQQEQRVILNNAEQRQASYESLHQGFLSSKTAINK